MSDGPRFQWTDYEDLPEGEFLTERFESWKAISDDFGSERMSVSLVTIGPGEEGPMHSHDDPVEEYYFVHEGTLDIEVRDSETDEIEVIQATAGSIFYFPPGVEHRPINRYDEPAVELAFRSLQGDQAAMEESMSVAENGD